MGGAVCPGAPAALPVAPVPVPVPVPCVASSASAPCRRYAALRRSGYGSAPGRRPRPVPRSSGVTGRHECPWGSRAGPPFPVSFALPSQRPAAVAGRGAAGPVEAPGPERLAGPDPGLPAGCRAGVWGAFPAGLCGRGCQHRWFRKR